MLFLTELLGPLIKSAFPLGKQSPCFFPFSPGYSLSSKGSSIMFPGPQCITALCGGRFLWILSGL